MIDWKDTLTLTLFASSRYGSDKGLKLAIPRTFIKVLKQTTEKDYSSGTEKTLTVIGMDLAAIRALNINITLELICYDNPNYIHEFRIEEEFKVVLGLLQGSPAAKILHGE